MFLGQLPKRLVIGCVDSDALNGTITKNLFVFKYYKINFVALNVDGRQIPAKRLIVWVICFWHRHPYAPVWSGDVFSIECQSLGIHYAL
jgi:hypothetical protein